MRIFLVRHGEKTRDEAAGLTLRGGKQAQKLGTYLKKEGIDAIISSDLLRCRQTAVIVGKAVGKPITYDTSLREIEGEVRKNPEKYPKELRTITEGFEAICKMKKENVVVVASGGVIRVIIAHILEISPAQANFVHIPTGITLIEKTDKLRILCVNETAHLPKSLKVRQSH